MLHKVYQECWRLTEVGRRLLLGTSFIWSQFVTKKTNKTIKILLWVCSTEKLVITKNTMKVLLTGRISEILDSEGGGIILVFNVIAFAKYIQQRGFPSIALNWNLKSQKQFTDIRESKEEENISLLPIPGNGLNENYFMAIYLNALFTWIRITSSMLTISTTST